MCTRIINMFRQHLGDKFVSKIPTLTNSKQNPTKNVNNSWIPLQKCPLLEQLRYHMLWCGGPPASVMVPCYCNNIYWGSSIFWNSIRLPWSSQYQDLEHIPSIVNIPNTSIIEDLILDIFVSISRNPPVHSFNNNHQQSNL